MTHENYGKSNFYGKNICIEIKHRRSDSKVPTQRCDALEKSRDFTSKKYDSVIETIKKSNSQAVKLDKKYKEVTDSLEQKHAELVGTTNKPEDTLYRIECSLDETQQYLRRDCLEITGVTIKSDDNPEQIIKEIGSLIQKLRSRTVTLLQHTSFLTLRKLKIA